MGPLGFPELIIIFVVALLVFGPRKLPELGRSLGKGLSEFKRASNDLRATLDDEIRDEERRTALATPPAAVSSVATPPVGTSIDPAPAGSSDHAVVADDGQDVDAEPETVARGQHTV
jgi:TatA/E family protein of Tat protein translocase